MKPLPPPPRRKPGRPAGPLKVKAPKVETRLLTKYLRELALEAHDMDPEGRMLTKAECLARLLWKKALGFTDTTKVKSEVTGQIEAVEEARPPEAWAIQLIYERMEGKVAPVSPEDVARPTVADRVSELGRSRINKFCAVPAPGPAGTVPPPDGGVDVPDHRDQGPEGFSGEPGVA